jgi:hypothetical protein
MVEMFLGLIAPMDSDSARQTAKEEALLQRAEALLAGRVASSPCAEDAISAGFDSAGVAGVSQEKALPER